MADNETQEAVEEVRTGSRELELLRVAHTPAVPLCAQVDAAFDAGLKKKKKARRLAVAAAAIAAPATGPP
jgi:hypothetical protein